MLHTIAMHFRAASMHKCTQFNANRSWIWRDNLMHFRATILDLKVHFRAASMVPLVNLGPKHSDTFRAASMVPLVNLGQL